MSGKCSIYQRWWLIEYFAQDRCATSCKKPRVFQRISTIIEEFTCTCLNSTLHFKEGRIQGQWSFQNILKTVCRKYTLLKNLRMFCVLLVSVSKFFKKSTFVYTNSFYLCKKILVMFLHIEIKSTFHMDYKIYLFCSRGLLEVLHFLPYTRIMPV